ncbi:MAG: hypothetical protein AAF267_03665 [Deinococcota bacterium]
MSEPIDNDTLRDEYNFSNAKRGEFKHLLGKPYSFEIHYEDGSTTTHTAPALIALERDVQAYFPDGEAVHKALRGLIALLPETNTPSD